MNHAMSPLDRPDGGANLAMMTRALALAAAATVPMMVAIFIVTGIGQDPLQFMHTPQDYAAILLKNPMVLRATIGLDNAFIVLYSTMFLTLGATLWDRSRSRPLLTAGLVLMAALGLLDLMENMHFLTMIGAAVEGMEIPQTQIALQVWESLVKFHVSYLGLFLLGFALPMETPAEKALAVILRWVQLPVGMLIYLVPAPWARPLVFGRFIFFVVALLLIWTIFGQRKFDSSAPA